MMPGMDGLEVCRRIRQTSQVPVIMLTARGDEADRVVGLELGADDYVPEAVLAARAAGPAAGGAAAIAAGGGDAEIVVGPVAIDVGARRVRVGGEPAELTGLEFDILLALARRPGRVVPRETLLAQAGRDDVTVSDRTVDVHVSHLRRKLGDDPRAPRLIKTVRGVGYVLAPEDGERTPARAGGRRVSWRPPPPSRHRSLGHRGLDPRLRPSCDRPPPARAARRSRGTA